MTGKSKKEHSKSMDKFAVVSKELYKVLCETIKNRLQNSIKEEGITEQEIEAAREFAELKPNTKVAKKLLKFIDSQEVKEALKPEPPDSEKDGWAGDCASSI